MLIIQAKCRAKKTPEEKDLVRQKDKDRKANRRANMTKEEIEILKDDKVALNE